MGWFSKYFDEQAARSARIERLRDGTSYIERAYKDGLEGKFDPYKSKLKAELKNGVYGSNSQYAREMQIDLDAYEDAYEKGAQERALRAFRGD